VVHVRYGHQANWCQKQARRKAHGGNGAPHLVRPTLPVLPCPCSFSRRPFGFRCSTLPRLGAVLPLAFCLAPGLAPFACPHGNLYVLSCFCVVNFAGRPWLFCLPPLALRRLSLKPIGCYRVKPHGQLVHVSCTHCCASTPCLSTSWSPTALQGASSPSENSSWEGLPA
jgi:hypothetical protein